VVFAWLIADGDMHLKNLAMLKTAEAGAKVFTTVRFAPLYDAVTTRVFPGLAGDRMALKLNGKDDRLDRRDFLALARTIGLTAADSEIVITDLSEHLIARAGTLQLPDFAKHSEAAGAIQERVLAIVSERCSLI
jgi:serine/threonine-protein kinase HipA